MNASNKNSAIQLVADIADDLPIAFTRGPATDPTNYHEFTQ